MIDRAASLCGMGRNEFILVCSLDEATSVVAPVAETDSFVDVVLSRMNSPFTTMTNEDVWRAFDGATDV